MSCVEVFPKGSLLLHLTAMAGEGSSLAPPGLLRCGTMPPNLRHLFPACAYLLRQLT